MLLYIILALGTLTLLFTVSQIFEIIQNVLIYLIYLKNIDRTDNRSIKLFTLIAKLLFDIVTKFKDLEEKFKLFKIENLSLQQSFQALEQENGFLKQGFQNLQEDNFNVEAKYKKGLEIIKNLGTENSTLFNKTKLLEANQKALIEELGGVTGKEDLEYATWDLIIHSTKLLIKERDEAIKQNQLIKKENNQLTESIKNLEPKIGFKNDEIKLAKQSLTDVESKMKQIKVIDTNSIQQLQTHLAKKELNIKSLETENQKKVTYIKELEKDCWEKESILKNFMIEKGTNETKLKNIEKTTLEKELNLKLMKEQNLELISRARELENEIKSNNLKAFNMNEQKLAQALSKIEYQLQEKEAENSQLSVENSNLKAIIKELMSKAKETLRKIDIPNYSFEKLTIELIHPDKHLNFNLVDEYDELIYFVQSYFPRLELTTIEDLVNHKDFYAHLISRLYLINWLLIYKVRDLEKLTINGVRLSDVIEFKNYEGKALHWCNQELMTELNILLSKTYFLNDQIFSISYFM